MSRGARFTLLIATAIAAVGFAIAAVTLGPNLPAGPRPLYGLAFICGVIAVTCAIPSLRPATVVGQAQRTRTLDDSTAASDPGGLRLSHRKLRRLRPDLYGLRGFIRGWRERLGYAFPLKTHLAEHLMHGDSRAAVVMRTGPLLVAAYTDELDCVVMLRFPDELAEEFRLREGSRLLTVNTYQRAEEFDADLAPGPGDYGRLTGFHPIVAEFVSDDTDRIERQKEGISTEEWERAAWLGREYLKLRPGVARDGRPGYAAMPANAAAT